MAARQITQRTTQSKHLRPAPPFSTTNQPKNRGKRPPVSLTAILQRVLAEDITVTDNATGRKLTMQRAEAFVRRRIEHAMKADKSASDEVWTRIEGKVPEQIITDNTNHDDAVIVVHEDKP